VSGVPRKTARGREFDVVGKNVLFSRLFPHNRAPPAAPSTLTVTAESPMPSFSELGLSEPVLAAVSAVGYESPSPIQAQTIPVLLSGADVLGQAQTGTGKTAAFALPVLSRIDLKGKTPQALVLVPTRELAIQVAEAFQRYATQLQGFHVLPIYGGQSYTPQLKGLKRGAHVVVGTPGRVMDHMKSGALQLASLRFIVLDEGDEMLQMGFVDDIEWILEQSPTERQIALFSATMPAAIKRIAHKHMRAPTEITIQNRASTAPKIRQRYWLVSGMHKLDALTRVLEVTRFDAMLVFVRTKFETTELAERLEARGFGAAPLNGDIPQQQRERTVARLKAGQLDILVATDVAARGLDVERISHVVNYDIPYDSETYVHRIGRTGRAGRSGEAILFVAPRERNMLRIIERVTRQKIEQMTMPSAADVNEQRVQKFKERIVNAVQSGQGEAFRELIAGVESEQSIPAVEIAAALASLLQGATPFLLQQKESAASREGAGSGAWSDSVANDDAGRAANDDRKQDRARTERRSREHHDAPPRERSAGHPRDHHDASARELDDAPPREHNDEPAREHGSRRPRGEGPPMESFRIEVGHVHGVQPGNIVGAIANEAGLDGKHIGHIDIREDHSFVDLPEGMPKEIFRSLKKVRVRGTELRITHVDSKPPRLEREGGDVRRRPTDGPPRGSRFAGGARKRSDARRPAHGKKRH
jgi:ATP-dependent RNA helicase DeaD